MLWLVVFEMVICDGGCTIDPEPLTGSPSPVRGWYLSTGQTTGFCPQVPQQHVPVYLSIHHHRLYARFHFHSSTTPQHPHQKAHPPHQRAAFGTTENVEPVFILYVISSPTVG